MHPQLQAVTDEFASARERLHRLAATVPADRWAQRPSADKWSPAECVAHLNLTSLAYIPQLQDGLRQAQLRLPDLIVLDLMLPVKTGEEVCRELRSGSRTRDIPIVIVNRGTTRGDDLATIKLDAGCAETLAEWSTRTRAATRR